jgi:hypothetical protein
MAKVKLSAAKASFGKRISGKAVKSLNKHSRKAKKYKGQGR